MSHKKRTYWSGSVITELKENEVFVFGSNTQARHFAGAARAALSFGAIPISKKGPGIARGLSPNGKTYALVTKNLEAGTVENGITYTREGYRSVSLRQIKQNIAELYETAKQHPEKRFLITYQYEFFRPGHPKRSLNGYTSKDMFNLFTSSKHIPCNIIFHESYKPYLEPEPQQ